MDSGNQKSQPTPSVESSELLAMWLMTFSQLYHQEIEELAALAYRDALKEFSAAEIERGCRAAIRECVFIPKPAEIIELINATRKAKTFTRELPEARMTPEDAKRFFAEARAKIPWLADGGRSEGATVEITEEMRARAREKQAELERKYGKRA